MKLFKKIALWSTTGFLILWALVFMPSFSSVFSLLMSAVIAPISKWQELIRRYVKKPIRIIAIVVLAVLMLVTVPSTAVEETHETDSIVDSAETDDSAAVQNEPEDEQEDPVDVPEEPKDNTAEEAPVIEQPDETVEETPAPQEKPQQPEKPTHTHSFVAATCTAPKTCSSCGETSGEALGHHWNAATCTAAKKCSLCGVSEGNPAEHQWNAATCTAPKTCANCGEKSGSAAGHRYSNGSCSVCGGNDPNYVKETMVWIPTNGGKKYHSKSTCSQMENPDYVTKSEAINLGFDACGKCYK